MKTKDQYLDSLAAELKEWSAQIDLLTAKTEKAAAMHGGRSNKPPMRFGMTSGPA